MLSHIVGFLTACSTAALSISLERVNHRAAAGLNHGINPMDLHVSVKNLAGNDIFSGAVDTGDIPTIDDLNFNRVFPATDKCWAYVLSGDTEKIDGGALLQTLAAGQNVLELMATVRDLDELSVGQLQKLLEHSHFDLGRRALDPRGLKIRVFDLLVVAIEMF